MNALVRSSEKSSEKPSRFSGGLIYCQGMVSPAQRQLLDEASQFGIRFGFTVPIHDGRGPIAALTFAVDQRKTPFEACVNSHGRVRSRPRTTSHSIPTFPDSAYASCRAAGDSSWCNTDVTAGRAG